MTQDNIGRAKVREYAERLIRMLEEEEALKADISEIRAQAKSEGYSVKALNAAVKKYRMTAEKREEAEQLEMEITVYYDAINGVEE